MGDGDDALEARVAALEAVVEDLIDDVQAATNRDLPLLKGSVRAAIGADIDTIDELPDAGRRFRRAHEAHAERLDAVEHRLAAYAELGADRSTKAEKLAAIAAFADNKAAGRSSTVAVTADEVQGCVGVSRRYAYDLLEVAAGSIEGMQLREPQSVATGHGTERKKKALLVDCDRVHVGVEALNRLTTVEGSTGNGEQDPIRQEGH